MGEDFEFKTDYLFSEGSYLLGAGSVLDLSGNYFQYNLSPDGAEADRRAIACDWGVIGQDMKKAMGLWEKSNDTTRK
jgi:hypothetical protein